MDELQTHPSVSAWRMLGQGGFEARAITSLKPKNRKSSVFRLHGVGPSRETIIAKHCACSTAEVERTVYEHVLNELPVSSPRFYGSWSESGSSRCWLFLEDVGDETFDSAIPLHRRLAAEWLGALHLSSANLVDHVRLPERGLPYYRDVVSKAHDVLGDGLNNQALFGEERALLGSLRDLCTTVLDCWKRIQIISAQFPRRLVHGGFSDKNIRIRSGKSGTELMPFDWEAAGWGLPFADLWRIDLDRYLQVTGKAQTDELRAACCDLGVVLWCLSAVPGEAKSLSGKWPRKVMRKMQYYHAEIEAAISRLQ